MIEKKGAESLPVPDNATLRESAKEGNSKVAVTITKAISIPVRRGGLFPHVPELATRLETASKASRSSKHYPPGCFLVLFSIILKYSTTEKTKNGGYNCAKNFRHGGR
jgi:hypothetical protein